MAFDQNGKTAREEIVRTAGSPAAICLGADRTEIAADGKDLCYVTVRICDMEGNPCPMADNNVDFVITGAGGLLAVDNGDPTSLESFQANHRKAFHGICNAIVVSENGTPGEICIRAQSEGLKAGQVCLKTL